tara:strand:- start:171 stop:557 length:387 start_codon:yes stop_codon:yes gene_type:complete
MNQVGSAARGLGKLGAGVAAKAAGGAGRALSKFSGGAARKLKERAGRSSTRMKEGVRTLQGAGNYLGSLPGSARATIERQKTKRQIRKHLASNPYKQSTTGSSGFSSGRFKRNRRKRGSRLAPFPHEI